MTYSHRVCGRRGTLDIAPHCRIESPPEYADGFRHANQPHADRARSLVCLAAIGRALEADFQPRAFLDDFSTALQSLVPHHRLRIGYLADDRRTFSVFAEHGGPSVVPTTDRYTTNLQRVARFPATDALFGPLFAGGIVCVPEMSADVRFEPYRDSLSGLRSTIMVPLVAGSRIIGYVSAASRELGAFSAIHVERMRTLGCLLGPFVEVIAGLYRERRRRAASISWPASRTCWGPRSTSARF